MVKEIVYKTLDLVERGYGEKGILAYLKMHYSIDDEDWENIKNILKRNGIELSEFNIWDITEEESQDGKQSTDERRRAYVNAWKSRNKERLREYDRRYRSIHKERIRERNREYYRKNNERMREYHRRWYANHKGVVSDEKS